MKPGSCCSAFYYIGTSLARLRQALRNQGNWTGGVEKLGMRRTCEVVDIEIVNGLAFLLVSCHVLRSHVLVFLQSRNVLDQLFSKYGECL